MATDHNFRIKNGLTVGTVEVIDSSGKLTANAFGTNSNEKIEDVVADMITGSTHSNITVTYNDTNGTLAFSAAAQYGDSDVESYLDGGTSTPSFASITSGAISLSGGVNFNGYNANGVNQINGTSSSGWLDFNMDTDSVYPQSTSDNQTVLGSVTHMNFVGDSNGNGTGGRFYWGYGTDGADNGTFTKTMDLDRSGNLTTIGAIDATKISVDSGASLGLRVHTNSGITASNNYMNFFTGQTSGWSFNANGTGADSDSVFTISPTGTVSIPHTLNHVGDTDTYVKFDDNRVRIVNGGTTYLDTNNGSAVLTNSTSFGGDVSGTYNAIVIADDSHNHVISNVDGLQSALDTKIQQGSNATAISNFSNTVPAGGFRILRVTGGSDRFSTSHHNLIQLPNSSGNDYQVQIAALTGSPAIGWRSRGTSWTDWYEIYHEGHKPTYAELGTMAYSNLTGTPTIPSLSGYATESYVGTQISNLVDSAPGSLDTLNELAAALGDDANFSTTVTNSIATKLPKSGGTMTGLLEIAKSTSIGDPTLDLHNTTNGYGVNIRMTDVSDQSGQFGYITYYHQDSKSYGSGASITLRSTESTTTILADGKLMYGEGIYSKPSSGTGAGTRKDQNWDTAYGWGNHASAGYLTGNQTITLTGDVTGSGTTSITTTVANDSHTHDTRYFTETETSGFLHSTSLSNLWNGSDSKIVTFDYNTPTNGPGGWVNGFKSTHSNYLHSYITNKHRAHEWHFGWRDTNAGTGSWVEAFHDDYHPNADKWTSSRTLTLGGDLSGSVSFDGSANFTLTAAVADDSHNHIISNVDGLQSALDGKLDTSFDHAQSHKTWTGINASATQAKRYHIARLYGCPAHWDGDWQNIEFTVTAESYESGYLKFRLMGDYGGAGSQANMIKVFLTEAHGPMIGRFQFILGSPVDAGWDHSGQDTFYVDLYAEAAHYSQWKVNAKTYGHGYQTSNPSSGGATTVFYTSPTTTNTSTFDVSHNDTYIRGNKIWNVLNDGASSGLDADLLDGSEGSYYLNYNNLTNKPTIPTNNNQLTNGAGYITSFDITTQTDAKYLRSDTTDIMAMSAGNNEMLKFQNNTSGGIIQLGFQQNDTDGLHHRFYIKTYKGSGSASGNVDLIVRGTGGSTTSDILELHSGQRASWQGNDIFTDAYHPNADTLTTARTIAGSSFNGSANIDINYNNLTNKPTIPTNNNQLTNGAGYTTYTANQAVNTSSAPTFAGMSLNSDITFNNSGTTKRGIRGTMGDNDMWFIGGGASASNAGYMEIATGDDGQTSGSAEQMYFSQYGPGSPWSGTLYRRHAMFDSNGRSIWNYHRTPTGVTSILSDASIVINTRTGSHNYIQLRNDSDDGTHAGLVFTDNNHGGSVLFTNHSTTENTANRADTLHLSGYQGVDIRSGTGDASVPANKTRVARFATAAITLDKPTGVSGNLSCTGTFTCSSSNTTGGGIILADDGDIVDLNDAYCSMRFSYGVRIFSGNRSGSAVIALKNNGEIIANSNITAYGSASDIRLKENIETIKDPIKKVQQLRGVTFDYKKDGSKSTGLIAQELEKVLPEVVYETVDADNDDNKYKAVRYGNTVGLLVEAIKEQQEQIEELKSIINTLMESK